MFCTRVSFSSDLSLLESVKSFSKKISVEAHEKTINVVSFFVLQAIFAAYLWFVLVAGPKFMEKRKPYNVTVMVRIYNVYQVISCVNCVVWCHLLGFTFDRLFKCERFDYFNDSEKLLIKVGVWLFLSLRTSELVETIFFVLRKKQNQASFLHIFHHIGSVFFTWLFIASGAGKFL